VKQIPSLPSAVLTQIDPVVPTDIFRDIAVGDKRPNKTHSARDRETYKSIKAHPKKEKEFLKLYFSHEPLH
jgi:hypothetical protein